MHKWSSQDQPKINQYMGYKSKFELSLREDFIEYFDIFSPIFHHFHPKREKYPLMKDLLEDESRRRPDRLDLFPSFSDHDDLL